MSRDWLGICCGCSCIHLAVTAVSLVKFHRPFLGRLIALTFASPLASALAYVVVARWIALDRQLVMSS